MAETPIMFPREGRPGHFDLPEVLRTLRERAPLVPMKFADGHQGWFAGGFETTANMLALGTYALLRHPDQRAALERDPRLVDNAVEELMRYLTISHVGPQRAATEDVEVEGVLVEKGQAVMVSARRGPARGAPLPLRRDQRHLVGVDLSMADHSTIENQVRTHYTGHQQGIYPTENTMYLNFGYWKPGCASLDEACQTLVDMLADTAGIGAGDRVLDAGFGYADQDMHWLETRRTALIAGLNVTPAQVEVARQRARERNLDDRLDLRVGSATSMPFGAGTFDQVVALESAFHFDTRDDFFREAHRVLRPGGVLATADVILQSGRREERIEEMGDWQRFVPAANWYDRQAYLERLHEAGFTGAQIEPITDNVYEPLLEFLTGHLQSESHELSVDTVVEGMRKFMSNTEYVLASATKPAG